MLISCKWLSRHVDLTGIDFDELGRRFTLNVAELEGIHRVGADAAQAVVGHVLSAEHVEGTHLSLCSVDTGDASPRQIICGAPNVAAGQSVPVFLPGMTVGDLTIAERKVRGHLSQGMIASEQELGLSDEHDGIMVLEGAPKPGTSLGALIDVEDVLFEIDNKSLTHRPDCWGHRGIAREVAALVKRPLRPMNLEVSYTEDRPLDIRIEAPDACPRYLGVTLDGVTIAPSPMWLKVLLHRVGVRAINNVVDATNFVMLDLGNPLHAFDRREVQGDTIVVRWASEGETFTTLDGTERTLIDRDLLIGDGERGVALAGIMGGENSEIRDDTTSMILEAANFNASIVRMTSSRLGLRTDSSARFEKSLDPHLAADASKAFCVLLQSLDPNVRITSALMDVCSPLPECPVIDLSVDLVSRRLGIPVDAALIRGYLEPLGFTVDDGGDADHLKVTVPTYRASKDIGIAADLIEEVGRSYGYDNIPPQPPMVRLAKPHANKQKTFEARARGYLTQAAGMDEVLTYSFDSDPLLERIGAMPAERVRLRNAISAEMPAMRTRLGPNLLSVLEKNARREETIRVFEIGRVFGPNPNPDELPIQPVTLGGLAASVHHGQDPDARLFAGLKGVILGLAKAVSRSGLTVEQGGVEHPWAHPVRQARLLLDQTPVGYLAEVHPQTLTALDVKHGAAVFELNLDAWLASDEQGAVYQPLPRFPSVFRDFAVVVSEDVRADAVANAIRGAAPDLITDVAFQSVFRGAGVPDGQKSMAWSVTLLDASKTLTDGEVKAVEDAVWAALRSEVNGEQRV